MTITVTVRTTNPALRASLREPSTKTFKTSGRGLLAAVKWGCDWRNTLRAAQGNLSYPRVSIDIDGTAQDFDWIMLDLAGEYTVRNAEAILSSNYSGHGE